MAQLLTACEEAQFLPESFCWAANSNASKRWWPTPSETPSDHIVCSSVASPRGARWEQIQSSQESFVHRWGWGARKGHTMSEVLLPLFLDIEQAQVNEEDSPVFGCFLDYTKYFDFFSCELTLAFPSTSWLAPSRAGLDATVVRWTHTCSRGRQPIRRAFPVCRWVL